MQVRARSRARCGVSFPRPRLVTGVVRRGGARPSNSLSLIVHEPSYYPTPHPPLATATCSVPCAHEAPAPQFLSGASIVGRLDRRAHFWRPSRRSDALCMINSCSVAGKRAAHVHADPNVEISRAKELRLSFVGIDTICNLQTLENLRVLRLDNNKISKIENLSHLVNLEWLGA